MPAEFLNRAINTHFPLLLIGTQPQNRTYYISLSISNKSPDDVTLSFLEEGQLKEEDIPKSSVGSIMMTFTSNAQPPQVEFKAFKMGTATAVMLNGTESLKVTPTENIVTIPVAIGSGRFSSSL